MGMNELVNLAKRALDGLKQPAPADITAITSQPAQGGGYRQEHQLTLGNWIEFHSPVFGLCTGLVSLMEGDTVLVDQHSILKALAPIKAKWVVRLLPGPPAELP